MAPGLQLTNPYAVDYSSVIAQLSNPGQIDYDAIEGPTEFFDIKSYTPDSVTFQAKSNLELDGHAPTEITFKFLKDGVEVSTSQIVLSVGIPIHKPVNDAIQALYVEPEISPTYESKFYAEASKYFDGNASTNVEAGVSQGLSYGWFTAAVRSSLQASFADNQPNVTYAFGTTAEASITLVDTDEVKADLTVEYSDLYQQTGTPVNKASIYSSLMFSTPPTWIFQSIGLDLGVESEVNLQRGDIYNTGGFIRVKVEARW